MNAACRPRLVGVRRSANSSLQLGSDAVAVVGSSRFRVQVRQEVVSAVTVVAKVAMVPVAEVEGLGAAVEEKSTCRCSQDHPLPRVSHPGCPHSRRRGPWCQ